MAHMIPRQILQKVTYGEQKVFDLLKNTPSSKDWYVLHSLNLPPLLSRTILSGSVVSMPAVFDPNTGAPSKNPLAFASEIDFLVIAPQLGIFCLEVKSGEVKRDKDGIWTVSDKSGQSYPSSTGPFSQAENAMHKIINIVKNIFGKDSSQSRLLISHGVIFTSTPFTINDPEIEKWRICNCSDIEEAEKNEEGLLNYIKTLSEKTSLTYRSYSWFDEKHSLPDKQDAYDLYSAFRPGFEFLVPPKQKAKEIEERIYKYTGEQFKSLDIMDENPHCLFKGGAGTGKTILALEAAKRNIISGQRVLLSCYNRLLCDWLLKNLNLKLCSQIPPGPPSKDLFAATYPQDGHPYGFYAAPFLDYLESLLPGTVPSSQKGKSLDDYYKNILPYHVLETISKDDFKKFDTLIIDEGQDLIRDEYLDVMDSLLVGGLQDGRWIFFCDFEGQNIFNEDTDAETMKTLLKKRSSNITIFPLNTNCRNTLQISEAICRVTNISQANINENISGFPVKIKPYKDTAEEIELIKKMLAEFSSSSIQKEDITILSPHRMENSCINEIADKELNIINLSSHYSRFLERDTYTFSTIQKFKGMENSHIIIVDLDEIGDENYFRNLIYIAMSRARVSLAILINDNIRKALGL